MSVATGSMTRAQLVQTFSQGTGVELARSVVDEAIRETGHDPEETESFSVGEVIEICEAIRRDNSGFVSMQAVELQVKMRAERRFGTLFNNIPDPAVSLEYDGGVPVITAVNRAFEDEFDVVGEDVAGESIHDVVVPAAVTRPDDDADGETSVDSFTAAFDRALAEDEKLRREIRVETDAGDRFYILHAIPNRGTQGRVSGYVVYADITPARERERALTRQKERLEEFASFVSHDLRNPLNVAHGYLELALEDEPDPVYLENAMESLERMEELISGLLVLAREGEEVGELRDVSLDEAVEDAWSTVETADADLVVESDLAFRADEEQLRRLLENLVRNVVEHAGSDSTVWVGALDDSSGFYFEDDGPGIPDDLREEVFESGFTTNEGGTGFGLGIVNQIARAHDWSVDVAEGRAGGTRFEITGVGTA